MNKAKEVKNDIYWVGALDPSLRVFDIIMYTDYGTTYNSYVVKGSEKTVLVEVAKEEFFDEFLERLNSVVDPESIDYIVLNHTEPDHSGSLRRLLEICPGAQIVATGTAIKFLGEITNLSFPSITVKNGDKLSIGDKTLEFIVVPFLHWPDSMYTYIKEEKTLFTCDSFGCHYSDERVFNDLIEGDQKGFEKAYKYYFDCIFGPFKSFVRQALSKIKDLDIETICNGHGPVLRRDIQRFIKLYHQWSEPTAEDSRSVAIVYVTAYGYTKLLAQKIAEGIREVADFNVKLFDLTVDNKEVVLEAISASKGVLFGSPTIVGDTVPPMWHVLSELNPVIHKGKVAGAFGSYGWSGEAAPNIEERLRQLRFKIPEPCLKVCFNPSKEQLELAFNFGKNFAEQLL